MRGPWGRGCPPRSRATYMVAPGEYLFAAALGELFAVSPDRLSRLAVGLALDPEGVVRVWR